MAGQRAKRHPVPEVEEELKYSPSLIILCYFVHKIQLKNWWGVDPDGLLPDNGTNIPNPGQDQWSHDLAAEKGGASQGVIEAEGPNQAARPQPDEFRRTYQRLAAIGSSVLGCNSMAFISQAERQMPQP